MAKQDGIHFSDGEKALCGAENEPAVTDKQKVGCAKCQELLAEKASDEKDPLVEVRISCKDLDDGVDFSFVYRRPAILTAKGKVIKSFPLRKFRLVSGAKHRLPLSVVEHLEKLAHPIKAYRENAPEGKSMVITGMRHRFSIARIGA